MAAVWPRADDTGPVLLAAVPVTDDVAVLPVEAMWPAAEVAFAAAEEATPATAEAAGRVVEAAAAVADDPGPVLSGEPPVTPFAAADPADVTVDAADVPAGLDTVDAADVPAGLDAVLADRAEPTAADAPVAVASGSGALGWVAADAGLAVSSDAPMATAIPATAIAAAHRHSRRMWVTSPLVTNNNLGHPAPKV